MAGSMIGESQSHRDQATCVRTERTCFGQFVVWGSGAVCSSVVNSDSRRNSGFDMGRLNQQLRV